MLPPEVYRAGIADRLRTTRQAAGLSQITLAEAIGMHDRTIRAWEAGVQVPPADAIGRISQATRRSADWILGRPDGDFACVIHARVESAILAASRLDREDRLRALRVGMILDADAELVSLREFGDRIAALANHIEEMQREKDQRR